MVSSSDSPLLAELRAMSRLITSADRRLAAISKVVRVRVLFSKNRLNTLLPRSSGTFLTSRSCTLTKLAAVSRMCVTMSRGRPSMDSRWISSPLRLSWGLRLCQHGIHASLTWNTKLPPSLRASASDWLAGSVTRAAAKSACTGSSRPPRSTNTARRTLAGRP
jgi:hypothetical protein